MEEEFEDQEDEVVEALSDSVLSVPGMLVSGKGGGYEKDADELWKKILDIQKSIEPLEADGEMEIGGTKVKYATKNNIVGELRKMMSERGIICTYEGAARVDHIARFDTYRGRERVKVPCIFMRYWVCYALRDIETGGYIRRVIPADAASNTGKWTTIAQALALRDFLSQMFLVNIKNGVSVEELESDALFSPVFVAKTLDMGGIAEVLRIKAAAIMKKVTTRKIQAEAKRRGYNPSSWEISDMTAEDMLSIIQIAMDLIKPDKAKEDLRALGEKSDSTTGTDSEE